MDIPVVRKCDPMNVLGGPPRMIWVDTVFSDKEDEACAICVCKDGTIARIRIVELSVCEDSKPRILLDPEKLQAAMKRRLGTNQVMMPGRGPGGMQVANVTRQRVNVDEMRKAMGIPEDGEKKEEDEATS